MVYNILTELCNYHHDQFWKLHHPQKETLYGFPNSHSLFLLHPPSQPKPTTILFSEHFI